MLKQNQWKYTDCHYVSISTHKHCAERRHDYSTRTAPPNIYVGCLVSTWVYWYKQLQNGREGTRSPIRLHVRLDRVKGIPCFFEATIRFVRHVWLNRKRVCRGFPTMSTRGSSIKYGWHIKIILCCDTNQKLRWVWLFIRFQIFPRNPYR